MITTSRVVVVDGRELQVPMPMACLLVVTPDVWAYTAVDARTDFCISVIGGKVMAGVRIVVWRKV